MLETVDLEAKVDKDEYREAQAKLDLQLPELQRAIKAAGIPVIVVFEGWDAAGKGMVLNRLLQPLDPRGYKVFHIKPHTPEEQMWPPLWRFWNRLPVQGNLAVFNHSWYREVLDERVDAEQTAEQLSAAYERIRVFERQLADDGAVILKFFFHISKKEQAKRFKSLRKDPAFAWKVGKAERWRHKHYDAFYQAVEDMLRETSTPYAPWIATPATNERFRNLKAAETLAAFLERALAAREQETPEAPVSPTPRRTSPLDRVDLSLNISKEDYDAELPKLQDEARRLQHLCYMQRRPVVLVYEGWDAAGKGGNIRRLTRKLDPRGFEVIPIGAPEGEEKHHHHLWRFWRALPKAGHFAIFDRSWYGRVMVERVEGFATPSEWSRAYQEINEFEDQLSEYGTILCKFWLHISKEEQLSRFEARQNTPEKQWKITEEDWRNRSRWDDYWHAVSSMIERTSTVRAPWTIVEGNDKRYARLKVLRVLVERLRQELEPVEKPEK
jgi:AMP-polyphosphate phosphotransferase